MGCCCRHWFPLCRRTMADPTTSRTNRNLGERERRSHMRSLYSWLSSLLPPHPTRVRMSRSEIIENSIVYVRQLQELVEELKRRKAQLVEGMNNQQRAVGDERIVSPVLEITDSELESTVQVNLIAGTGMETWTALGDIVTILEAEGAEVVNVSYSNDGHRLILSVDSKAVCSRIGIENSRVRERLQGLQILRRVP